MTYYEELGLSRSASVEEIRQAYKALARLVHPDQCADARLRGLAELQMKRLNQMLAVLSDPEQRQKYDATLDAPPVPEIAPAAPRRPGAAGWVWLLASGMAVGAIIFFFTSTTLETPQQVPAQRAERKAPAPPARPAAAAAVPQPGAELRQDAGAAPPPREQPPYRPDPPQPQRRPFELPAPPAAPTPAVSLPPPPAMEPPPRASAPRFAGDWFYVPSGRRQPMSSGLYPPEFIELRLVQDGGNLRGRYRARYRVTDQAISPDVSFEFNGAGQEPLARFSWTGPGGAAGEVVLKLLSETAIEVNWKTFRLSDELSLASGMATLVRQQSRD